jgi:hypothetical protein
MRDGCGGGGQERKRVAPLSSPRNLQNSPQNKKPSKNQDFFCFVLFGL